MLDRAVLPPFAATFLKVRQPPFCRRKHKDFTQVFKINSTNQPKVYNISKFPLLQYARGVHISSLKMQKGQPFASLLARYISFTFNMGDMQWTKTPVGSLHLQRRYVRSYTFYNYVRLMQYSRVVTGRRELRDAWDGDEVWHNMTEGRREEEKKSRSVIRGENSSHFLQVTPHLYSTSSLNTNSSFTSTFPMRAPQENEERCLALWNMETSHFELLGELLHGAS